MNIKYLIDLSEEKKKIVTHIIHIISNQSTCYV